jgi:uncharacterized protein YaiL (DUF2058 family)
MSMNNTDNQIAENEQIVELQAISSKAAKIAENETKINDLLMKMNTLSTPSADVMELYIMSTQVRKLIQQNQKLKSAQITRKQISKIHYEENKEQIKARLAETYKDRNKEKVLCDVCNCLVTYDYRHKHEKSTKHKNLLRLRQPGVIEV